MHQHSQLCMHSTHPLILSVLIPSVVGSMLSPVHAISRCTYSVGGVGSCACSSSSSLCLCLFVFVACRGQSTPAVARCAARDRWAQGKACGAGSPRSAVPGLGWVVGCWAGCDLRGVLYIYYARARRPQTKAFWAWVGAPHQQRQRGAATYPEHVMERCSTQHHTHLIPLPRTMRWCCVVLVDCVCACVTTSSTSHACTNY